MAEEPVVIGRGAAARDFPSDFPAQIPNYPGKALTHRFLPTEQPRIVEEATQPEGPRLAGTAAFKPIASFAYPDRNVYLGPVRNVRPRGIQPVAIDGKVTLPMGEGQPFEVSEELRGPLEARVNRLAALGQGVSPPPEQAVQLTASAEPVSVPLVAPPSPPSLTELERLKAAAVEELAKREVVAPTAQAPLAVSTAAVPPTPPQEVAPILPKLTNEVQPIINQETAQLEEAPSEPVGDTQKLISEAERLETELAETLKQITSEQKPEKTARSEKEKTDEYLAQISQLVTDRTQLLKQVNDLTASSKEAQARRSEAETKLEESTKEFNRLTQSLRIEKTNLGEQVKTLEQKIGGLQQKQELIKEASGQVVDLRNQLAAVEKERDNVRDQVGKLQGLLLQLQKSAPATTVPKRIVSPQAAQPSKEPEAKVRVVKPQVAVGRMAPSLTSAPNVINGIVKDSAGYLLSNVILVVKDKAGEPVRALKTNKIGQFAISTPLPNGTYVMELEAEGHNFDAIQVEIEGKLLPPLEIRAND